MVCVSIVWTGLYGFVTFNMVGCKYFGTSAMAHKLDSICGCPHLENLTVTTSCYEYKQMIRQQNMVTFISW